MCKTVNRKPTETEPYKWFSFSLQSTGWPLHLYIQVMPEEVQAGAEIEQKIVAFLVDNHATGS